MDPNTRILGTLGGHFGTFGLILVTRGCPGGSKRHPLESEEVFNKLLTDFWVSLGDHFGIMLVTFPSFVVSKWEVRLRTSFVCVFCMEKQAHRIGFM